MYKIKEILEQKKIKQTWLAKQLGKSFNIENFYVLNRQQSKLEVLYDVAKILDVEIKIRLVESKKKK